MVDIFLYKLSWISPNQNFSVSGATNFGLARMTSLWKGPGFGWMVQVWIAATIPGNVTNNVNNSVTI